MKKEFTASVYFIEEKKVLLVFHPKFRKWLPPGGHLEDNETPAECALREAQEETGFTAQFISKNPLRIDYYNARTIDNPYLTLLAEVPAYGSVAAHQHIDFIFVARITGEKREALTPHEYRWFSKEELLLFKADDDIFKETLEVIDHLLTTFDSTLSFATTD